MSVLKTKDQRGIKMGVRTCSYNHKGDMVMAGCSDGSIQMWDSRAQSFHRPQIHSPDGHDPNVGNITCLKPMHDSNMLVSRSNQMENKEMKSDYQASLKLWDIRNTKSPVKAWRDASLCNFGGNTNVSLSANERVILTGSSVRKGRGQYAFLHMYDTLTGESMGKEAVLPQDESLT